ncbi:MAG: prolyl oligopeptidase family protein [Acidimicrobiales bacterium]
MTDAHLWLEDVDGEEALAWVRAQNERSLARLEAHPDHAWFEAAAIEVLTAEDRIVYASLRGGHAYDFWQDARHVKGIWRRSPVDAYLADRPRWETLLDVDALAAAEGENWVFAGASVCRVDGRPTDRYLVSLSVGGRDATTVREFDLADRRFVDPVTGRGFVSPEAKQAAVWLDPDRVLLATDWGEGTTTESGYPRSVRLWHRGTAPDAAVELFTGASDDVGVWPLTLRRADGSVVAGAAQRITFHTGAAWLFPSLGPAGDDTGTDIGDDPGDDPADEAGRLRVPIPERADLVATFDDQAIVSLQEDWALDGGPPFSAGDLVSFDLGHLLDHATLGPVRPVFSPTERQAVQGVGVTSERVVVAYSDNVASRLAWLDPAPAPGPDAPGSDPDVPGPDLPSEGPWRLTPIELPGTGVASIAFAADDEATVLLGYQDYLTPDSLYRLDDRPRPRLVRPGVARFDPTDLTVTQRFVPSSDGTEIPYFLVHRADLPADGSTPTLLYAYGGFEISLTPTYSATVGRLWLEEGGAYAVANIRGGGEFGPAWHQAGLKQKRRIISDDFLAVAQDLIDTGVTRPARLGIMGGSNGGLLMGVMLTQRPDLWGAVVLQVPLLDMLRYHLLLAGASWVDEYGSPDVPDERTFLETLSPYHRFDPTVDYPEPFFVTSTKDDRVHPGHARKLARRFDEAGKPFLYFENIDGGHGAATTQLERARRVALEFTYLTDALRR